MKGHRDHRDMKKKLARDTGAIRTHREGQRGKHQ